MLEVVDRVFRIVFARFRRKRGDSNILAAWNSASYRVNAYTSWAVTATLLVAWMVVRSLFFDADSTVSHKSDLVLVAVVCGFAISWYLDHRFKKYLVQPPELPESESSSESRYVFFFRLISFGIFAIICAIGYLLHLAGGQFSITIH